MGDELGLVLGVLEANELGGSLGTLDTEGGLEGNALGFPVGALDTEGVAVGELDGGNKNLSFQSGLYGNFKSSFETAGGLFRAGTSPCSRNNRRSSAPLIVLDDLFCSGLFVVV